MSELSDLPVLSVEQLKLHDERHPDHGYEPSWVVGRNGRRNAACRECRRQASRRRHHVRKLVRPSSRQRATHARRHDHEPEWELGADGWVCVTCRRRQRAGEAAPPLQSGPPIGDWVELAVCVGHDPSMWDVDSGRPDWEALAREACSGCPVRDECLADALASEGRKPADLRAMIRGGLDPHQREAVAKRRRAAA